MGISWCISMCLSNDVLHLPLSLLAKTAQLCKGASCRNTRRSLPLMAPAFFTAVTRPPCGPAPSSSVESLSLSLAALLLLLLAALPPLDTASFFATSLKQSAHQLSHWSPSAFLFSAPRPIFSSRLAAWTQSVRPSPRRPKPSPSFQPYFSSARLPKSDSKARAELTPAAAASRSWYFLDICAGEHLC